MLSLFLAAVLWVAVHVGIAGTTVRRTLAGRLGDGGFRGLFSALSVASISFLVWSYIRANKSDPVALWTIPAWLGWVLVAAMAVAFIFFVGSVATPNPTAVGGEKLLGRDTRSVTRITRHPMLWSFAIWSLVHMVGNGTMASLLFFGAFGLTSLVGMPSIDRKVRERDPEGWARLSGATSILPFGAIATHRNRFAANELLIPLLGGLALWLIVLVLHPKLFGVSALG